jgi:4-diphosphocytidyl-2-C-methyl-D-erythritol kinase
MSGEAAVPQASARGEALRALAPAKVNLGLFLGPMRERDGRHELVTVMQSISLADEVTLEALAGGGLADEVLCPGVPGPPQENLAARALAAFRAATGWSDPAVRITVAKRIPLAAGLAGGSADAAAVLRLAAHASGLGEERLLRSLAQELGADVPAQVAPGRWLATGAGERLRELPAPAAPFGLVVLPLAAELSTAAVYAEADRLGLARAGAELAQRHEELLSSLGGGAPLPSATELLHNDLQRAAVSLCPSIARELAAVVRAGADLALVSGSGPTVLGLCLPVPGRPAAEARERAERVAGALAGRVPAPILAEPVDAAFARSQRAAFARPQRASQSPADDR